MRIRPKRGALTTRQVQVGLFVVTVNGPIRYGFLIETHVGPLPHWHIVKFLGASIPEAVAQRHLRAATAAEGAAMGLVVGSDHRPDPEPSYEAWGYTPLKNLCVHLRTKASLLACGFRTLEEVCQLTGPQLIANTPNFGVFSLNDLVNAAMDHGLALSTTPHPGYWNPPLMPRRSIKKPGLAWRRRYA